MRSAGDAIYLSREAAIDDSDKPLGAQAGSGLGSYQTSRENSRPAYAVGSGSLGSAENSGSFARGAEDRSRELRDRPFVLGNSLSLGEPGSLEQGSSLEQAGAFRDTGLEAALGRMREEEQEFIDVGTNSSFGFSGSGEQTTADWESYSDPIADAADNNIAHANIEPADNAIAGIVREEFVSAIVPGALRESLTDLVRLIANVTESYSTTLFLADQRHQVLSLVAAHTLSRDLVTEARIGFGCGLVGWTAENSVRVSVCPFEHDATTLLYYRRDQALKSFIAVPIIDRANNLRGVIACDSKKTYAFAKLTEKILLDCAAQAATLIELHLQLGRLDRKSIAATDDRVIEYLEQLRSQQSERTLLTYAADIPRELVERDALVIITTDEPGSSASAFYSSSNQTRVGHRLLELVCRHKKVICGERSVQALSGDDSQQRSFLSIPFRVLKREAGSINLLSRPFESFSPMEISVLEKVALTIGKELELHRLRDKLVSAQEASGLLRWEQFAPQATAHLKAAAQQKQSLGLARIAVTNIFEIENFFGIEAAQIALNKVMRLVEQVKGSSAIACYLYGNQILVLAEKSDTERMIGRFSRLLDRIQLAEDGAETTRISTRGVAGRASQSISSSSASSSRVGELISSGVKYVMVHSAREGSTLEELTSKSRHFLEMACQSKDVSFQNKSGEVIAHAGNW